MRLTRAAHDYTISKVKKEEEIIACKRITDAMLNDGSRDFWTETKRLSDCKSCVNRIVDGQTEASSITQLFEAKHRVMFPSVLHAADDVCY